MGKHDEDDEQLDGGFEKAGEKKEDEEEEEKKAPGIAQVFDDGYHEKASVQPVVNGGHVNLENDHTLIQHE